MKGTFTNTLPVFGGGLWNLEQQAGETMNAFVAKSRNMCLFLGEEYFKKNCRLLE